MVVWFWAQVHFNIAPAASKNDAWFNVIREIGWLLPQK